MKTARELHVRGRDIVMCECFDFGWPGNKPMEREGVVTKVTPTAITVQIPDTQPSTKIFNRVDIRGYLYDRNSFHLNRGWRMKTEYAYKFFASGSAEDPSPALDS